MALYRHREVPSSPTSESGTQRRSFGTLKYPNNLDDEDLGILKANKIEAISFLSLTKEDLLRDAIKRGPASLIASYDAELNGMNFATQSQFSTYDILISSLAFGQK